MPLTDPKIRGLKPKAKPFKTADFDGLYLLTNPTGSKLWRHKYRIQGKEKLLSLGRYPDLTLLEARTARDDARRMLAQGIDPSQDKQEKALAGQIAVQNSFQKVAEQYVEKLTKEGRAEITIKKVNWLLDMAKADFGTKPITEITPPLVLKTLRKVESKGIYETARRLRSTIGAVFRFAIASGFAESDPTIALQGALITPKVKSRAAITDKAELGKLLRAIDKFTGQTTTKIALQLLAIVATRPGELRKAKWGEFDLEKAIWTIPAENMKCKEIHKVPLPPQAISLLTELQKLTGHFELLFPATTSARKPMSENTLNQAIRRMGFTSEQMTAHGFRATFSTLANESGKWNPDAIERALAHVERNEVRRAYARATYWKERVRLANWWASLLTETIMHSR